MLPPTRCCRSQVLRTEGRGLPSSSAAASSSSSLRWAPFRIRSGGGSDGPRGGEDYEGSELEAAARQARARGGATLVREGTGSKYTHALEEAEQLPPRAS